MNRLILLLIITLNCYAAEHTISDAMTYDEFLKIKSYFHEKGCEGVEHFLQSSKDMNLSDSWYSRNNNGTESTHGIKNLPYQNLCLLSGSTEFEADGEIKDTPVKFMKNKNYWENQFPKNEKIIALVFRTPMKIRKKCNCAEWKSSMYYTIYHKEQGKLVRKVYSNSNADQNCTNTQLQDILKTTSKTGTTFNPHNDVNCSINIHETMDADSKVIDTIACDQKVTIIGTINLHSFIYYNKKTKIVCDPLKEQCNSGWVDSNFIVTTF